MNDRPQSTSITDRVRALETGGSVAAIHFIGSHAVFAQAEEALLLVMSDGEQKRVPVHDGGILAVASDGKRIVTGGDDGKVISTDAKGDVTVVASDERKRWIDHVAVGPDGAVAWSTGKTAFVQNKKSEQRQLDVVSTVGGLAFAPKGVRLAIAHYNGATLWFPNAQAKSETLEWKGSHLGVTMSPDGRFVVTSMQEPMLHGWRIADGKHMRMSGYAARVRSMQWTASGDALATGGSDQLILWPFSGKDGPMGKQPTLLAPHAKKLGVVACHPKQPVVAVGYDDGMVLIVRIDDGAEILVHRPDGDTPVTALAWNGDGTRLAFACEDRAAGIVDLG